jgi:hypothetical protein
MSQLIVFLCLWTLAGFALAAYLYPPSNALTDNISVMWTDNAGEEHHMVFVYKDGVWQEVGRYVK